MDHRTALLIHIVVPGQKIALTPPSVVIQFIPRLKEGKLFLHTSEFFSIDLDIEVHLVRNLGSLLLSLSFPSHAYRSLATRLHSSEAEGDRQYGQNDVRSLHLLEK